MGDCYVSVLKVSLLNSRIFSWHTLMLLFSKMYFKVQAVNNSMRCTLLFPRRYSLKKKPASMRRDNKKKTPANGKVGIIICLVYLYSSLPGEKSTEVLFYLNLKNPSRLVELLYW